MSKDDAKYVAHREAAAARNREMSLSGRDISSGAWVHAPVNAERRALCERNFRAFCESYLPATFPLPWSADHLKVIAKIETAVLEGGLFAMAMPRGSGKSSLCESACLWALLYGHREFVALFGADASHASSMLDSIKVEMETNEAVEQDFSEVVGPVRAMEGIHQRANGQLYLGRPTAIGWTADEIVLPSLPPLPWLGGAAPRSNGAIVKVAGITGRIRGMKHKRVDGTSVRPSLVLIDDPQTEESAGSPMQCAARERIITRAILGLAGPGRKIAGLMTLTVVRPDDLADRILDREKHPHWQGERTRMVYSWPTNTALWEQYTTLMRDGLKTERGIGDATAFYVANRAAMDAGAAVAWEHRHNPDEASAVQHAMNLRIDRGDAAFFAEFQNDPLPEVAEQTDDVTSDMIVAKINGHARGVVPHAATAATMFIDVQQRALYWAVLAWEPNFTGYVVDYGTEPDQRADYFNLRDCRFTLADAMPHAGIEGAIYGGLDRLVDRTVGREWECDGGGRMRIDRCLIDANWGQSSDLVYQFCRQTKYAGVVMPSHGRFVGAGSVPFSQYTTKKGDRVGANWRIPAAGTKRVTRHVIFDTNFWKSFIHARLAVPLGDAGCLSLFGRKSDAHTLFAEHLTAEYRVRTEGRGRTVDEWKIRADGRDNHWLDCAVGCAVAASMSGVSLLGEGVIERPRQRIRMSDRVGGGVA